MIEEDFENAISLRNQYFPKSFFKYRELSKRTIENFRNNYIWLAEITSLNDPFECSIQFDNDECLRKYFSSEEFTHNFNLKTGQILSKHEINLLTTDLAPYKRFIEICSKRKIAIRMNAEQQLNKIQKRWREIVNETNQNLRICSFSTIKDSLLLWSHYSNEHKGVCFEYDFQENNLISAFIQPVMYCDKIHKIGLFEEYSTMQMIGSSLVKSLDWKYEKEWRLTIFKQKDKFPQKLSASAPKAIYLGTRFHENEKWLIDELLKEAKNKKTPIYQMDKHPTEFKLTIK